MQSKCFAARCVQCGLLEGKVKVVGRGEGSGAERSGAEERVEESGQGEEERGEERLNQ